jgi:hypothetical protein
MKRLYFLLIALAVAGCRRGISDEDEIRELLESDPLFQVTSTFSGKPNTGSFRSTMGPQNWYRYIFPDSVIKTYNITVVGDSAFVHAIWTFKGQFRIITGISGDTFNYSVKLLYDKAERYAICKKIGRRWRLVKITGVKFYPVSGSVPFTIDSVAINSSSSGKKTFTDPLNTFLDTSQIVYRAGEMVEVKVYLRPTSSAYGYIHYWNNSHHRDAMVVDTVMVRGFSMPSSATRKNFIADVITRPSFDTSNTEYLYEAWGFPYVVR